MPFLKGIEYHERPSSPQESMGSDGFRARRIFDTPWETRWKFLTAMFGSASLEGVDGHAVVLRELPEAYKVDFGTGPVNFMYPAAIESIEHIGNTKWNTTLRSAVTEWARVSIGYETLHYRLLSDEYLREEYDDEGYESCLARFVSIWVQPSAEYLTLPHGSLRWSEPGGVQGVQVTGSYGRIQPSAEIMIVWHRVPGLPTAISQLLGSVNAQVMGVESRSLTFHPQTLLYTHAEVKPYRWFDNRLYYDITMKFKHFDPQGDGSVNHNTFLQYNGKLLQPYAYRYLTHDGLPPPSEGGTSQVVYSLKDFGELFSSFPLTDESIITVP